MSRLTTIELHKESMKFSAGHFTILSKTKRERLHGHNFSVHAIISAMLHDDTGMTFDYREYKNKLQHLCHQLNESFLIPSQSPFARIESDDKHYFIHFNEEIIPFLKSDITLLALKNITVEELSLWFIEQLLKDNASCEAYDIQEITIKVFTGPGQSGASTWKKNP